MNGIVQTLNTAGRAFVGAAVPMLIQSSLLILILLVVDGVLRKRVRAVFRYWIWMLVLVKLVLPPSLWSPVSVGTWFGETLEVPAAVLLEPPEPLLEEQGQDALATRRSPAVANFLFPPHPVTVAPALSEPCGPAAPGWGPVTPEGGGATHSVTHPPAPPLNWQGFVLLVWGAVVAALLLLLAQRAFFVRGLVAQGDEAGRPLLHELDRCRQHLGLRQQIGARLSPNAASPAVCGLWRPVILIPQSLAARLRGTDLHAVLFHELAHVKRGDLWINLLQTILQIFYFYNPLLWLANALIRRIREQAVDEVVLVALGESASQYPDTLINVAKLALARRPALSLRLIGVVESKSALTSRIKHILSRPFPKSAKLGLLGLSVILLIAAVLLPMAKGNVLGGRFGKDVFFRFYSDDKDATQRRFGETEAYTEYTVRFRKGEKLAVVAELYQDGQPMRLLGCKVFPDPGRPQKLSALLTRNYLNRDKTSFAVGVEVTLGAEVFRVKDIPVSTPRWYNRTAHGLFHQSQIARDRQAGRSYVELASLLWIKSEPVDSRPAGPRLWIPGGADAPTVYGDSYFLVLRMLPASQLDILRIDPPGGPMQLPDGAILPADAAQERRQAVADEYVLNLQRALMRARMPLLQVIAHQYHQKGTPVWIYLQSQARASWKPNLEEICRDPDFNPCFLLIDGKEYDCRTRWGPSDRGSATLNVTDSLYLRPGDFHLPVGKHTIACGWRNVDVVDPNAPDQPVHFERLSTDPAEFEVVEQIPPDYYRPVYEEGWEDVLRANLTPIFTDDGGKGLLGALLGLRLEGLPFNTAFAVYIQAEGSEQQYPEGEIALTAGVYHYSMACDHGVKELNWDTVGDKRWRIILKPSVDVAKKYPLIREFYGREFVTDWLTFERSKGGPPHYADTIRAEKPVDLDRFGRRWPAQGAAWPLPAGFELGWSPDNGGTLRIDPNSGVRLLWLPEVNARLVNVTAESRQRLVELPQSRTTQIVPPKGEPTLTAVLSSEGKVYFVTVAKVNETWANLRWEQAREPTGRATAAASPDGNTPTRLNSPKGPVASLPNGVTVELLGACDYPSEGKQWWRPDGSPLAEAPYDGISQRATADEKNKSPFELALRVGNLPADWDTAVRGLDPGTSASGDPPDKAGEPQKDLRWLMIEVDPNQTTGAIRFGLAGAWRTVARGSPQDIAAQAAAPTSVAFSGIQEIGTLGFHVGVKGLGHDSLCRVLAVTREGEVKESSLSGPHSGLYSWLHSSEDAGETSADFWRLPLSSVKELQLQTRPVTCVEFRNVPLRPGLKTDLQVDVRSADTRTNAASLPGAEREREIVLPEADRQHVILDLATGELVPLPPVGPEPEKLEQALRKLGKGDLLYDCDQGDRTLILMRNATSEQAQGDTGEPPWKGYLIGPYLPAVLTVKTAEGRQYKVTILAADDKACTLKYSPVLTDKGAGRGVLGGPEQVGGTLELRIAPRRGELGPDAVEEFTKALAEGRSLADSRCLWVPVQPGVNLSTDLVTQTHQGKTWLLVYNDTSLIMVPSQGWRLVHVGRSTDENGRPMLVLRFDETGAEQMVRLTRAHADQLLAIVAGGIVVSTPIIPQRQEGIHCATITGEFTEQALADMTAALRRGIAKPAADASSGFSPITLRNGVTVELLGVCEHPSVGKQWWRPDGSPLTERPYDDDDGRAFPKPGEKGYKLAIRFSGLAGKGVGAYAMPSDAQSTNGGSLDQTSVDQEIVSQGVAFDQELDSFDLRVGVSRGPWKDEYWQEIGKSSEAVEWAIFKNVTLRPQRRNEADKGAGGGALAAPRKDVEILGFHIAPTPEEVGSELVEKYRQALTGGGRPPDGTFAWFKVWSGTPFSPGQITCEHNGATYLLLWNDQSHVMRADGTWGLEDIREATDDMGRRIVVLTFDAKGVQLFHALGDANLRHYMAVVFEGRVITIPFMSTTLFGPDLPIIGRFTPEEIQQMMAALKTHLPAPRQTQDLLKRRTEEVRPGRVVLMPNGRHTTPVQITEPMILRGESAEGCIIEVTADQPALLVDTKGQGAVTLENLTIRWQLAGNEKAQLPAALWVKGTNVIIRNCRFAPLGDFQRSPMAVYIDRPSKSTVEDCWFGGFDYVICYGPGTEGTVQDCLIADCGHQGVIGYDGSTLTVQRNIITGSKFHAVRCTGGILHVKDNLLIKNANRGIYLGNKTGQGTITNNLILGNGSGISGFGRANYVIANNVIADNSFSGIDMRDSCRFSIRNNVLVRNQRGLALFKEGTENLNVIGKNAFWANATDVENLEKPAGSLTADPRFTDPNQGDFTAQGAVRAQEHGLMNPQVLKDLWQRYEQLQRESSTRADAVSQSSQAPVSYQPPTDLAWQRTDRYVPPDPNGFFPDDSEGGRKLDALFRAVDKDQRSDEEILSTVRQGFRRTTQSRSSILAWVGSRYIWGKDPQNPQAVEIIYHVVPIQPGAAVYYGLSVLRHKPPNVLRTLAEICLQGNGENMGRILWGLGPQREELVPYLSPCLQDPDAGRRELADALVRSCKGELNFEQWQRQKRQEQIKGPSADQMQQIKQALLAGDSKARFQALITLMRSGGPQWDDSLLPAMQAAATDPDRRVRDNVARLAGNNWVWAAEKQDPNAIALMVQLGGDSDRGVRYQAVYYGLSVVRDKSEPVVRRLVELALTDHDDSMYGRIVWGLRGFSQDTPSLVCRVLTEHLGHAKTDVRHGASVYGLYRDILGKEPPADWGLAQVRRQYPEDLFVLPFSAREPFQRESTGALWSEFTRALPEGIAAQRLPTWDTNKEDICYARIRGKEQAETVRTVISNHPRLRVGEVRPLPLATQLYLEERYGAGAVTPQKNQP